MPIELIKDYPRTGKTKNLVKVANRRLNEGNYVVFLSSEEDRFHLVNSFSLSSKIVVPANLGNFTTNIEDLLEKLDNMYHQKEQNTYIFIDNVNMFLDNNIDLSTEIINLQTKCSYSMTMNIHRK